MWKFFAELFTWISSDTGIKSYGCSKAIKNRETHKNCVVNFLSCAVSPLQQATGFPRSCHIYPSKYSTYRKLYECCYNFCRSHICPPVFTKLKGDSSYIIWSNYTIILWTTDHTKYAQAMVTLFTWCGGVLTYSVSQNKGSPKKKILKIFYHFYR